MIGVAEVDLFPVPGTVSTQPISFDPEPIDDLIVKRRSDGLFFFDDVYEPIDDLGCCLSVQKHAIEPGGKWVYALRIQNDGEVADDIVVMAAPPDVGRHVIRARRPRG